MRYDYEDHGINMNKVNDLDKKLSNGVLLFYGYSYENIPNEIKRNNDFGVEFFFNEKDQKNKIKHNIKTQRYNGFQDIGLKDSDIVFFDQSAVKGLLIGYPANAKYVLVNLNYLHLHNLNHLIQASILAKTYLLLSLDQLTVLLHNKYQGINSF